MLLILSENKTEAENLSDMMNFMGVLSFAEDIDTGFLEISEIYRAIVILSPEKIKDKEALLAGLLEFDLPYFFVGESEGLSARGVYLPKNLSSSEILEKITEHLKSFGTKAPGEYHLPFIDASINHSDLIYLSKKIELTKTELMIVRSLIKHYKSPLKPSEILKFAFRKRRMPDEASIRTHVSKINKKAMKISGRTLISNCDKNGYVLSF